MTEVSSCVAEDGPDTKCDAQTLRPMLANCSLPELCGLKVFH